MHIAAKLLIAVVLLGVVDAVIPGLPILALVLGYVLIARPPWFLNWVIEIYDAGPKGPGANADSIDA